MCLILFLYDMHPDYRLILAGNRDEFYGRPTSPLAFWDDAPIVLAGRDLKEKGTWLGVTRTGRIAAITNFRQPALQKPYSPSRGLLVSDFLLRNQAPETYLKHINTVGSMYNGFNLLVGDRCQLYYYSNKTERVQKLLPGLYGLSNHLLNTPWPKVKKGKEGLKKLINRGKQIDIEDIFILLYDKAIPPDSHLPDTGVGIEWERVLSPLFITSNIYGTRSSSIILIDKSSGITFIERSFTPKGSEPIKQKTRRFNFKISGQLE